MLGGRTVSEDTLSPYAASLAITKRIAAVRLDPTVYSGHSQRRSFLTSAVDAGELLLKLTEVSRSKSLDSCAATSARPTVQESRRGASRTARLRRVGDGELG